MMAIALCDILWLYIMVAAQCTVYYYLRHRFCKRQMRTTFTVEMRRISEQKIPRNPFVNAIAFSTLSVLKCYTRPCVRTWWDHEDYKFKTTFDYRSKYVHMSFVLLIGGTHFILSLVLLNRNNNRRSYYTNHHTGIICCSFGYLYRNGTIDGIAQV